MAARGVRAGGRASCRPLGIVGPAKSLQFKNGNGGLRSCGANYLRTRDKKRLDVLAARHLRMRRHEAVARFPLPDQRARQRERVLQRRRPAQRNIEKCIAEIGPFGAILAAEGRMIGVGRRDYQAIRVGEPRYEHAGIAGITARYRTCVALSMSARCAGVIVSCRRPATTARPSSDPCDVRMRKRTSLASSIFFPVARNVAASEAVVASPPFLLLNLTMVGSAPKWLATTCAAPVASV